MLPIRAQPRVRLDELRLAQLHMRGDGFHLRIGDDHIAGPAAAVSAALAEILRFGGVKQHDACGVI